MNRALAERLYEALAAGDRATLDEVLHPAFEGSVTPGMPLGVGGVHRGPEEMRRNCWGVIARHYRARAVPREFCALADGRLMVSGSYVGVGTASGRPLDAPFVHVLRFADGLIDRLDQLTDSHRWHQALGEEGPLETIAYSVEGGVAVLCLNRPDHRNAIDLRLAEDLLTAARRCAADPAVRAVLIKGNGPALTVGGDVDYFTESDPGRYGELFRRMTGPFHEAIRILSRLPVPIVTAAHGAVAGGGLGLLYVADVVVAAEGAKFATAFGAIGLSGDGGGSWFLPRLVGPRRAAQMYLQNKVLDSAEAAQWGLVTEVVPADGLAARADQVVRDLAAGPTLAFGQMRALLRASWGNTLSEQLLEETEAIASTGGTADAAAAIAAFAARRPPRFEGR